MKKLFRLLKNSFITYLTVYAAKSLNVNTNSNTKKLLKTDSHNLVSPYLSYQIEGSSIKFQTQKDLMQEVINYSYKQGKEYYNYYIHQQLHQYNTPLAEFLVKKLLNMPKVKEFFLKSLFKDIDFSSNNIHAPSESTYNIVLQMIDGTLDLRSLFEEIYKGYSHLNFNTILNQFLNKLNFEDLKTLISLIPEDFNYATIPTYLEGPYYGNPNFNFYNLDIILIRTDLTAKMKMQLLELLLRKNQTLLTYENLTINWSFGLVYTTLNNDLKILAFLQNKVDIIPLLYTYLYCLEEKQGQLTEQVNKFITGQIDHFINSYRNTNYPDAFRGFKLLQDLAKHTQPGIIDIPAIKREHILNAPFFIIPSASGYIIINTKKQFILTIPLNLSANALSLVNAILSNNTKLVSILSNKQFINEFNEIIGSPLEFATQVGSSRIVKFLSKNKYIQELSNHSSSYWKADPIINISYSNDKSIIDNVQNPYSSIGMLFHLNRIYKLYKINNIISDNPLYLPYNPFEAPDILKRNVINLINKNIYVSCLQITWLIFTTTLQILLSLIGLATIVVSVKSFISYFFCSDNLEKLNSLLSPMIEKTWEPISIGFKLNLQDIQEIKLDGNKYKISHRNIKLLSNHLVSLLDEIIKKDCIIISIDNYILIQNTKSGLFKDSILIPKAHDLIESLKTKFIQEIRGLVVINNKSSLQKSKVKQDPSEILHPTSPIMADLQPVMPLINLNINKGKSPIEQPEILEGPEPQESHISKKTQKTRQIREALERKHQNKNELAESNRKKLSAPKEKNKGKAPLVPIQENIVERVDHNPIPLAPAIPIKENDLVVIINAKAGPSNANNKSINKIPSKLSNNILSQKGIVMNFSHMPTPEIALKKIFNTTDKLHSHLLTNPTNDFQINLKLDSIQYLIINLIERIKDYQSNHLPPILTQVREALVKDFYIIDDRNTNINLVQLENFANLLICYAQNISNNQNNNQEIDFSYDEFVQHIQQFISHGLSPNLIDRDKFYIKALEKSLTKLQEYHDVNPDIYTFKDAISYHIGRIGEIRNQFSHVFKLENSYLFEQLINDDFRKIRNSIFHGHVIDNETLSQFIKRIGEFYNGIKNSLTEKNHLINANFAPNFVHRP